MNPSITRWKIVPLLEEIFDRLGRLGRGELQPDHAGAGLDVHLGIRRERAGRRSRSGKHDQGLQKSVERHSRSSR